jgi:hypothetical protein
MTPATDCLKCAKCSMPCGAPARMHTRSTGYEAADVMRCTACGHQWIEESVDECARAWRAEVEYEKELRRSYALSQAAHALDAPAEEP